MLVHETCLDTTLRHLHEILAAGLKGHGKKLQFEALIAKSIYLSNVNLAASEFERDRI